MSEFDVPFVDLAPRGSLQLDVLNAVDRVILSGRYVGGPEVEAFEDEWADYCGAKHCVMVQSGTQALRFVGHWAAGIHADVEYVVHWHGIPKQASRDVGTTFIIEDCCQAHGARLDGKPVGKQGNVACWSFYPTKNLGALGDAGAVTTDDLHLVSYLRDLLDCRTDAMQSAVLSAKLPYLDAWNDRRREIANRYMKHIDPAYSKPEVPEGAEPCWHHFLIGCAKPGALVGTLCGMGVEAMGHHGPGASLPIGPHLTDAQVKRVIGAVNEAAEGLSHD